jgi:hypothetical protein
MASVLVTLAKALRLSGAGLLSAEASPYARTAHWFAKAGGRWRSGGLRPRVTLASRPPRHGRGVCNEGELTEFIGRGRQSLHAFTPRCPAPHHIRVQVTARCAQKSEVQHKHNDLATGEGLMRPEHTLHVG